MDFPSYLACREGEDGRIVEKEDVRVSQVASVDDRALPASLREAPRNVTEQLTTGQLRGSLGEWPPT